MLDARLPVDAAERLLKRVTSPVHLGPTIRHPALEGQFKGLALVLRGLSFVRS